LKKNYNSIKFEQYTHLTWYTLRLSASPSHIIHTLS